MSLNREKIRRERYAIFDVLSDIGGIQGVAVLVAGIIARFLTEHNLENTIASRLYKIDDDSGNLTHAKVRKRCSF